MNHMMIALLALAGAAYAQHGAPVFAHRELYSVQGMQTVVVNMAVAGEADLVIFGAHSCEESELEHTDAGNLTLARLRPSPTVNSDAVGYKLHNHNAGEFVFATNFTTADPCWLVMYTETFTFRIQDPTTQVVVAPVHSLEDHDDHDHDDDHDHNHDHDDDHKSAAVGADASLLVLAAVSAAAMVMA